jgi:predicted small lipoprotein YifL
MRVTGAIVVGTFAAVLGLSACGQSGPLVLPKPPAEPPKPAPVDDAGKTSRK